MPYGAGLGETLDIFPAAQDGAPVLIYIHGGYWRMLSSKEFSCVALGPVPAGVTVISVNYALCPSVTIDEIAAWSVLDDLHKRAVWKLLPQRREALAAMKGQLP